MAALKKVQYKNYEEYLKSPKWQQVKNDYADNEQIEHCLGCDCKFGNYETPEYHHFKYSKDFNDDSWENLLIVCRECHQKLHDHFEHDSKDISLRSYILKMTFALNQQEDQEEYHTIMVAEDLWRGCNGEFSVIQEGFSDVKKLTLKTTVNHPLIVKSFESLRDSAIARSEGQ